MSTENIIHKNRGEDMKILLDLGAEYSGEPFIVTFTAGESGRKKYVCAFDGTDYTACAMSDGHTVLCLLDNHQLPCGMLYAEVAVDYPDGQMTDGALRLVTRDLVRVADPYGVECFVELTTGHSDTVEMLAVQGTLLAPVVKGEKGDKGDKGDPGADADITAAEQATEAARNAAREAVEAAKTALLANSQATEAERSRTEAERQREEAERQREEETRRQNEEYSRLTKGLADAAQAAHTATQEATDAAKRADDIATESRKLLDEVTDIIRGAENVNATLDGHTLTVTDRKGVTRDYDLAALPCNITMEGSVITVTDRDGNTSTLDLLATTDERVTVTLRSEVAGALTAGLSVYVFLDGSTQYQEHTADAEGKCRFPIPNGTPYRIEFPLIFGCEAVPPRTFTATASARSVEAVYVAAKERRETVEIHFAIYNYKGDVAKAYPGTAYVTTSNGTETHTADSNGVCVFSIPVGVEYTVEIAQPTQPGRTKRSDMAIAPEPYYIMGRMREAQTFTACMPRRVLTVHIGMLDICGVFIATRDQKVYAYNEFRAEVERGNQSYSDGVLIIVATQLLCKQKFPTTFAISIDEICTRTYHDNGEPFNFDVPWCSENIVFTSVADDVRQYDGLDNTARIIAEGEEKGLLTPAASLCWSKSFRFDTGLVLPGFLGSRGQWEALWTLREEIDLIISRLRPGARYTLSSLTTAKWSSDQQGDNAYYLGNSWNALNKNTEFLAVPFYAV